MSTETLCAAAETLYNDVTLGCLVKIKSIAHTSLAGVIRSDVNVLMPFGVAGEKVSNVFLVENSCIKEMM